MEDTRISVLYVEENQDGTTGGSHYCLLDLVNELDKKRFKPFVMFYEDNRVVAQFKEAGAQVIIFSKPRSVNLIQKLQQQVNVLHKIIVLFLRPFQVLYNVSRTDIYPFCYFLLFILRKKIHVVHMNNTVFAGLLWTLAAKITGKKIIVHERTRMASISKIFRYHHRYLDYILGMSKASETYLLNNGVDMNKYSTFYDRIDINKFKSRISKTRREVREEFGIGEHQVFLGIIGNLQRWKGQLTVIEALNILQNNQHNFICALVGDSSRKVNDDIIYFQEIEEKISAYDLAEKIKITGHRSDIPNILHGLDIFIHASTDPEPYGLVILEAMVMGKAVIASNEGGPVEMIINNESGLLIPPGDGHLLAAKLELLINDPELREKLGKNAFMRMEKKFTEIDISFIENLYLRMLNFSTQGQR